MRAAIYTRLSIDRTGERLGIERQEAECRALAEKNDWHVTAVYSDNSISAFNGAARPGYEQLLSAIEAGQVDVVIAWSHDRLNRRPRELERYVDVCAKAQLSTYTVRAGHFDLTTPSGRAVARTLAAWASYEVETTTERLKASRRQAAKKGLPVGGTRAFGYEKDGMTIIPEEAAILREAGQRIIAGESLSSIVRDLNARGIRTVRGNPWYRHRLNETITRKRYVGIREHAGDEYPAAWPPIFDLETFEQIRLELRVRSDGQKLIGTGRRYLLTGFAVCGLCGNKLSCSRKRRSPDPDQPLRQTYECRKVNAQEHVIGCEKISRNGEALDDLVTEAVLYRLDVDGLSRILDGLGQNRAIVYHQMRQVELKQHRLRDIDYEYAYGRLDSSQYSRMSGIAKDRLAIAQEALQRTMGNLKVVNIPVGVRVREAWKTWDLEQKRNILSLLIDKVVVHPQKKRPKYKDLGRFDPGVIEIRWRT